MGLTERLAYVISVDASGAAGFTKAAVSAEQLAASTTKAAAAEAKASLDTAKLAAAEAKAAGDAEKLAKANAAVEAASKKYSVAQAQANKAASESKAAAASKDLQSLEGAATKAGGPLNVLTSIFPQLGAAGVGAAAGPAALAVGVAAAGSAAVKFALDAGHSFADATAEVSKFKNVSGATAEQSSILRVEAKALGVDVDSLATAIFRMSKNINDSPQKFRDLGVGIAHTKDGTVDLVATLGNASDAYLATNDQVQKNAIVQAVAGRAGQEIIPILKAGSQALKEYKDEAARRGEVFDDGQLQKGFELRVAYREVQNAQEALSTSIGSQLAPALTRTELGLTALIDKANQLQQHLHGVKDSAKDAGSGGLGPIDGAIGSVSLFAGVLDVLGTKHEKAAKAAATLTEKLDNERAATERATKEAEDHAAAIDQETNAALGVVHADEAVASSKDAVAAAHKRVDDAQKEEAQHSRDLQRANRDTAEATRSVQEAEDRLTEARRQAPRDLTKARESEAESTHKVAEAEEELASATEHYGAESQQAIDAADKLASARETHADAADKLNQLQRDAAHPKSVADAENALADAKDRANTADEQAKELAAQDPTAAVTEAKKGLTTAEDAYRDALISQADQRQKLNSDLATGKVNAGELADSLSGVIDMLKAAGVDPAVLAGLENLRIFVAGQPGGSPSAPPIFVGPHVNPDSPTSKHSEPTFQQAPGTYNPFAPDPNAVPAGSTLNITVNAQTNADPNQIAAAIATRARIS